MNTRIKNVLVVYDSHAMLVLFEVALSERGINVITATCGAEADKLIQENELDLLVLDSQITPGPQGLELCAKYSNQVPVIMLSGDDIRQGAITAGAVAFIKRPFTLIQIMSIIDHI